MTKINTLHCDMDGVLVNFAGPALERFGVYLDFTYPNVGYDIVKGCNILRHEEGLPPITPATFWDAFTEDFWADLPMYPGAQYFLSVLETVGDVYLTTTPTADPGCAAGKLRWIERHFPRFRRKYVITPHKHTLARPDSLLIDDSSEACSAFAKAGGQTIMFPRPWNGYRDLLTHSSGNSYIYVHSRLKKLLDFK